MFASEGRVGTQLNLSATLRWLQGGNTDWQRGDDTVSIGWLEPLNAFMKIGALIAEDMQDGLTAGEIAKDYAWGTIGAVLEMPVMDSINSFFTTLNYSTAESAGEKLGESAIDLFVNALTGMATPAPVRQTAKGTDEKLRDTSADDIWTKAFNTLKSNIPGLRQTLPAQVDNLGREKKPAADGIWNFVNSTMLPGSIGTLTTSAQTNELERLREATNESSFFPNRKAPNSFTVDNEKISLSTSEKQEYHRAYGQMYDNLFTGFMDGDAYKELSDSQKVEVVRKIESAATANAKAQILSQRGQQYDNEFEDVIKLSDPTAYLSYKQVLSDASKEGAAAEAYATMDSVLNYYPKLKNDVKEQLSKLDGFDKIREIVSVGGSSQWYFDYKKYVKEIDDNGSVTQLEAAQAIERMRIEKEYKGALWQLQNSTWKEEKNPYTGTLAQAGFAPSKVIAIAEKFSEIDNEYSDWIRDEGKTLPTRNALKTSLFKAWLQSQGYIGDTIDLIMDEYIYWQMVPASETKQSEAYVRANPSLIR